MTTAPRTVTRHRAARRATTRAVLAAALAVLALTGAAARVPVSPTDAGYVSEESATVAVGSGTVQPAVTVCTAVANSPHHLALAASADGLPVTGYRITASVDPVPTGSYAWQTGERNGVLLVPLGESTWPADQTAVGWGIELPALAGATFIGTVSVTALGPGGWESAAVVYDWSILADWGFTSVTCDPHTA